MRVVRAKEARTVGTKRESQASSREAVTEKAIECMTEGGEERG